MGKRQAATLDTPLSIQLDSTCMKAPNFITANGDGINEQFYMMRNEPVQAFSLIIRNPNGNIVHSTMVNDQAWGGTDFEFADEQGPIPYLYTLQVTTMSGATHSASKVVHVIRDIYNECVSPDVPLEAGDQYDPRRLCDFLYPSNDFVCIE